MSKRDRLIELIGAYGIATGELAESRNMNESALRTVALFKAMQDVVKFVDKHYELKEEE